MSGLPPTTQASPSSAPPQGGSNTTDPSHWQHIADTSTPLEQRRHHEPPRETKPFPKIGTLDWPQLNPDMRPSAHPSMPVLDLHGYTRNEAHTLLLATLETAQREQIRRLLIITGKGTGGEGTLRRKLPQWLETPAFACYVRAYAPAPAQLGGEGAWVVTVKI